jgi:exonuclease SbcC
MANTRDQYIQYAKKIVSVLSDEAFYNQYKKKIEAGASNIKMYKKRLIQEISIDWIETIENVLPNLDTIVRNPRRFIVQEEDIVDVSLARSISTESIKHLAQHTNMISKVEGDNVTPSRILNITKEESYEIYENRFIYTLLLKLKDFVTMRYDKIKKASATQEVLQLDVESRFNLPAKKVSYRTEYMAQLSFDEVMRLDPETLTKVERVAKIDRIITDFLSSSFAKAMRNCAPVRPPITRTNVILKEPNFKKALTLWQFIETYQVTGGFSTSDEIEDCDLESDSVSNLRDMVALNTMLFESLYDHQETEEKMEEKAFVDMVRIGELDFLPDQITRDPWAQKMEDKLEEEEEKKKELEKEKSEELEPDKPEDKAEPEKPEEKPEEEQEEQKPEEEKEREEGDEENERDRETETPPRDWEDEDDDDEPDEDKFDKNLFEVKMLYKRPKEDRLRQEEIGRIKDAIDRCLALYRKQKQNEADEALVEKKRRHIAERAEALRRQREAEMLSRGIGDVLGDTFASQAAKIVLPKKDEKAEADTVDTLEQRATHEAPKLKLGSMNLNEQKIDAGYDFSDLTRQLEELSGVKRPKAERAAQQREQKIPKYNPWALSETTLNQKYSTPRGNVGKLEKIDENLLNIGKSPLRLTSANELLSGTFGQDKAKIVLPVRKKTAPKPQEEIQEQAQEKVKPENITAPQKKQSAPAQKKTAVPTKEAEPAKKVAAPVQKKVKAQTVSLQEDESALLDQVSKIINAAEEPTKPGAKIRISSDRDPWALSSTTLNQKYSAPTGRNVKLEAVDEKKISVGKINLKQKSVGEILGSDVFGSKAEIKLPKKKNKDEDKR